MKIVSPAEQAVLTRLRYAWIDARTALDAVGDANFEQAYDREEKAWDDWVDYVELHSLEYTEHDPRNDDSTLTRDDR